MRGKGSLEGKRRTPAGGLSWRTISSAMRNFHQASPSVSAPGYLTATLMCRHEVDSAAATSILMSRSLTTATFAEDKFSEKTNFNFSSDAKLC